MKRDPLLQIENVRLSFSGRGEKIDAVRGRQPFAASRREPGAGGRIRMRQDGTLPEYPDAAQPACRMGIRPYSAVRKTGDEHDGKGTGAGTGKRCGDDLPGSDDILRSCPFHRQTDHGADTSASEAEQKSRAGKRALQLMEQVEIDHPQERFYQYPSSFFRRDAAAGSHCHCPRGRSQADYRR